MKFKVLNNFFAASLCLFILFTSLVHASTSEIIRQQLLDNAQEPLVIDSVKLGVPKIVRNFYQYNDYQPVWEDSDKRAVLLTQIADSFKLGLSPEDYLHSELQSRLNKKHPSDTDRAQLDILFTDALVRLVYHLRYGKVVPGTLDPDWNLRREFTSTDQVARLHYALRSKAKLQQQLSKASNIGPVYQGLINALARYQKIAAQGGWPTIAEGQTIKPGMNDPRIATLEARLRISGDLPGKDAGSDAQHYNTTLEAAVKRFQHRHNLESDGVIGKETLKQMNIPVTDRIKQIQANLERIRWVNQNLGDEFVVVNIAGFQVYYAKNNQINWHSRAQVGTRYRKTPVFRDEITYIEFNPTWTVPPTILKKDILPKLKQDRAYLDKKNMKIIDHTGKIIAPESINWADVTAATFPYMIRQEPGPGNALGRVKIMFPNKHLVYLHDTPSKGKFNRAKRTFSSGCVRVEKPFELVEKLLKDPHKWNQQSFQKILDSGKTQRVNLKQPVPVLLLYFTARMGEHDQVYFFRDVYNRDNKVIKELKKPFKFVKPSGKSS